MSQPGASNPPSRGGLYGNEARRPTSQSQGGQQRRHTSSAGMGFTAAGSDEEEDMDINESEDSGEAAGGAAPQANASENPSAFTRARQVVSSYIFGDANRSGATRMPLNPQDASLGGEGAQDMPGAEGASAPHFGEQQEHNGQETGSQPQPPPPDHWAWIMMGAINNILNIATTTRDQVAHLEANLNIPRTDGRANGRAPTPPPGPRLAQPPRPRGPIHNREQVVIRTSLVSRWLGGNLQNAPPQPDASMLAVYEQQRRVHPRGALPAVNVPGNAILFSSTNKSWNRAMATYFIQHVLTAALNAEVPRPGGPRDFRARDQQAYFKTLVRRVCDCVQYIFQVKEEALIAGRAAERNAQSRNEMGRSRLLQQRVAKARNTPWLQHTVPALQMLNDDGMSSDEEDISRKVVHHIHAHPWRSEAATTLIRAIDDAILDDRAFSANRKSRPNARMWTPERSQSRRDIAMPFHATPLLPENFYNWEALRRRQDFRSRNLDPTDVYHPTQARPELLAFVRPTLQHPARPTTE